MHNIAQIPIRVKGRDTLFDKEVSDNVKIIQSLFVSRDNDNLGHAHWLLAEAAYGLSSHCAPELDEPLRALAGAAIEASDTVVGSLRPFYSTGVCPWTVRVVLTSYAKVLQRFGCMDQATQEAYDHVFSICQEIERKQSVA